MNLARAVAAMAGLALVFVLVAIYAIASSFRSADDDAVTSTHRVLAVAARRIASAYASQIVTVGTDLAVSTPSAIDAYGRRVIVATIGDNEGVDGGLFFSDGGIVADGPQRVASSKQRGAIEALARDIAAGAPGAETAVATADGDIVAIDAAPLVTRGAVGFARERIPASALHARRSTLPLIALAILSCAGVIAIGAWIVFRIRRDVRSVIAAIEALEADPSARPTLPDGDFGRIARAVTTMAHRRAAAEAQAQLSERLAAVGRLAANAAHEIRNPLNSLRLQIAVLQRRLGPDLDEPVRKLSAEIGRLDAVVRGMLASGGDSPVPNTPVDLHDVALRAIGTLEVEAETKSRTISFACDAPDTIVYGDDGRLVQLAINIIANAVDAAPPKTEVAVSLHPGPVLRVVDRGAGVSPAAHPRLFEPFFTTKAAGTGLGLAIAHEIARAHGARIDVASGPDSTAFSVDFSKDAGG